ncbi:MAG: 6-carboxytetrahydropterin synthase QueD [Chloroflexi bacterium]|nr:6-carboxytetrahydropterin synthase QueD [Chloroflexota bacterium]
MYQVSVRDHFDAAHYLRGYEGRCESIHGHRFEVVVTVAASALDDIGLVYDFTRLKGCLKETLDRLDHVSLNDTPPFDKVNPSSENIAAKIWGEMEARLRGAPVKLRSVQVWESPDAWVTYAPDGDDVE